MPNSETFAVIYRSGGTADCRWTRVLEAYPSVVAANAAALGIEKGGRKALVYSTAALRSHGLPVGWAPEFVDFDRDTVTMTDLETHHVRGAR